MSAGGVLLKTSMTKLDSQPGRLCHADSAATLCDRPNSRSQDIRMRRLVLQLLVMAVLTTLPRLAESQSLSFSADASDAAASVTVGKSESTYVRPTQALKLRNYAFDAFGPYPLAGSAVAAGINQYGNEPPEWDQGVDGYFRRFGSNVGIAVIGTTTRYALSQASEKTRSTIVANAKEYFPGRATPFFPPSRRGAAGTATVSSPFPRWLRPMRAPSRLSTAGIPTASARRMHSAWATTPCWVPWAETLPWSFFTAAPTRC